MSATLGDAKTGREVGSWGGGGGAVTSEKGVGGKVSGHIGGKGHIDLRGRKGGGSGATSWGGAPIYSGGREGRGASWVGRWPCCSELGAVSQTNTHPCIEAFCCTPPTVVAQLVLHPTASTHPSLSRRSHCTSTSWASRTPSRPAASSLAACAPFASSAARRTSCMRTYGEWGCPHGKVGG